MTRAALALVTLFALVSCGGSFQRVHAPSELPWAQVESLLTEGKVASIERLSSGELRLDLHDGRRAVATEPAPGDIERLLERCGEPCADVDLRLSGR